MADGITNRGLSSAARIAQAAALAVAAAETYTAIEMASKQEEIAKGYVNISREQRQYYSEVFVPCEDAELEEACSAEKYEEEPLLQMGRMTNSVRIARAGFTKNAANCVSRYCTGLRAELLRDAAIEDAAAIATVANMGRRYEEGFAEAKDDLRWSRRQQALNRGRDMAAQGVDFAGFAYGMFGRIGDQAAKGAAGAVRYLAYSDTRNDTIYPQRDELYRMPRPATRQVQIPEPVIPQPQPQPAAKPARQRILG